MADDNRAEAFRPDYRGGTLWLTVVASVLLLAGLWGYFAWHKWGGDPETPHSPTDVLAYFIFALAGTAVIVPGVALQIRKVRALAARGVTTVGRFEKISMFGKQGMSPTTIVYVVGDREYRIRRDLPTTRVEVGGTVTVLYDPQNPKRFSLVF